MSNPDQSPAAEALSSDRVNDICDLYTKLIREKRAVHINRGYDAGADYYIGDVAGYVGHAVNKAAASRIAELKAENEMLSRSLDESLFCNVQGIAESLAAAQPLAATEAAAMAATVPAYLPHANAAAVIAINSAVHRIKAGAPMTALEPLQHALAAPQAPVAGQPAEPSPADMLDWLDETNKRFKMGWEVGAAPAGNVSVRTIIMGGKPIREAIRAAMPAPKGGSNG